MEKNDFSSLLKDFEQITLRLINHQSGNSRTIANRLKKRATLLIGPRGVGKTTYLLKQAESLNGFYLSLDNPKLAGISFYDFGEFIFQNGYDTLICDEVHYLNNWSIHLKALYDNFPNKKIIATDSSSLILKKGLGDLSRRFVKETLNYVTFKEYLFLKHNLSLPSVTFEEITNDLFYKKVPKLFNTKINLQKEFKLYVSEGTRPFFFEGDYREKTLNIIDKIIYSDIPYFLPEIKERHLQLMRHVIGHLATSAIPTLVIESLSKNWAVAKTTVYNLLEVMNETSLIRIIPTEKQKKGTKGKKIFFADPTLYSALDGNLGNIRESFFVMVMDSLKKKVLCPENDEVGDFIVDQIIFEVGGKDKKRKQSDFVIKDNIDVPNKHEIPLWLLGFLE